jgi:phosphatidate phosphatase APP1
MDTRKKSLAVLSRGIGLSYQPLTSEETRIFAERARPFLLDYERGKRIYVEAGGRTFLAGVSGPDGHFQGQLTISDKELQTMQQDGQAEDQLEFRVRLPPGDSRCFVGSISLFRRNGFLVVSDIDDTIKISGVLDRRELFKRALLRPFEPVPEMSSLYRHWNREGHAQFCYVSGSPWQLAAPLQDFLAEHGFPSGPMFLRRITWSRRSLRELEAPPRDHKLTAIQSLANRFPDRRFILVGDSGEQDPEIYGEWARANPRQVQAIFIREVSAETSFSPRYASAFAGLRPEQWKIFSRAEELAGEVATR